jgi:hypothetical protein
MARIPWPRRAAGFEQRASSPTASSPTAGAASPTTYVLPTALLMFGAMLQIVSIFLPYWQLVLHAPQYPKGLKIQLFVNRMAGDVKEIDGLNHYIGMRPLGEGGELERSVAVIAIVALAMLLLAAVFIQNRWAGLLALPAVVYPLVFLADLYYWLYTFGHQLDPKAALSSSVKPFTPTILGEGVVGQFRTTATVQEGFYLAAVGSLVLLLGLYFHRRAYKPLLEARVGHSVGP